VKHIRNSSTGKKRNNKEKRGQGAEGIRMRRDIGVVQKEKNPAVQTLSKTKNRSEQQPEPAANEL